MIRWLLGKLGYDVIYVCAWGIYDERYSSLDYMMGRPVHPQMRVAPPWAKRRIVKKRKKEEGGQG